MQEELPLTTNAGREKISLPPTTKGGGSNPMPPTPNVGMGTIAPTDTNAGVGVTINPTNVLAGGTPFHPLTPVLRIITCTGTIMLI